MIPPAALRTMSQRAGATVVEVAASHSVYVSQPAAVADLIKQAASAPGRRGVHRGTCLYGTDNDQTPRPRLRRLLSQPRSGSQARPIFARSRGQPPGEAVSVRPPGPRRRERRRCKSPGWAQIRGWPAGVCCAPLQPSNFDCDRRTTSTGGKYPPRSGSGSRTSRTGRTARQPGTACPARPSPPTRTGQSARRAPSAEAWPGISRGHFNGLLALAIQYGHMRTAFGHWATRGYASRSTRCRSLGSLGVSSRATCGPATDGHCDEQC